MKFIYKWPKNGSTVAYWFSFHLFSLWTSSGCRWGWWELHPGSYSCKQDLRNPCPRDDDIGGVSAKAFFKVKHFWKAASLLVNIYWCIHCYWSAVISKIFCICTVKRGIVWECRMLKEGISVLPRYFWCIRCAVSHRTGHSRCPWVQGTAHTRVAVELVPCQALLGMEEANLKITFHTLALGLPKAWRAHGVRVRLEVLKETHGKRRAAPPQRHPTPTRLSGNSLRVSQELYLLSCAK